MTIAELSLRHYKTKTTVLTEDLIDINSAFTDVLSRITSRVIIFVNGSFNNHPTLMKGKTKPSSSNSFIPPNEKERLKALKRYQILDTPSDGAFDRVVSIASRVFNMPIALVTLVDANRIWFKAKAG